MLPRPERGYVAVMIPQRRREIVATMAIRYKIQLFTGSRVGCCLQCSQPR